MQWQRMPSCLWPHAMLMGAVLNAALVLPAYGDNAPTLPLHQRIDQLIQQRQPGIVAPVVEDAEFLRRIYLDLVGTIPSAQEAVAFLADGRPDRRALLIDRLLHDARFTRHFTYVLDAWLIERRPDKAISTADWHKYLRESVEQNKPLDQLVRELLADRGTEPTTRARAKFLLDRDCEPHLLTRDIGRILFGKDFQCAQCHDHPLINDYRQSDYHELYALVQRAFVFKTKEGTETIAERGEGTATFRSVFEPSQPEQVAHPRAPGSRIAVVPDLAGTAAYEVPPADQVRPVPKFSLLDELARQATEDNAPFRRNVANRLWAHMMGQGLVEPLDLDHPDNPPANPQLMDVLADELKRTGYDLRQFLRQLALSQTYQRSTRIQLDDTFDVQLCWTQIAEEPLLEEEWQKTEMRLKEGLSAAIQRRDQAVSIETAVRQQLASTRQKLSETLKALAEAQKARDEAQQQKDKQTAALAALQEARAQAAKALEHLGDKDPLTAIAAQLNERLTQLQTTLGETEKTLAEAAAGVEQRTQLAESQRNDESHQVQALLDATQQVQKEDQSVQQLLEERRAAQRNYLADRARAREARLWLEWRDLKQHTDQLARRKSELAEEVRVLERLLAAAQTASATPTRATPDTSESTTTTPVVETRSQTADADRESDEQRMYQVQRRDIFQQQREESRRQYEQLQPALQAARQELESHESQLIQRLTRRFAVAQIRPLAPESLAWSIMQATGLVDNQRAAIVAELAKEQAGGQQDTASTTTQSSDDAVQSRVDEKLSDNLKPFANLFAAAPGQLQNVFYATSDQALFLSNAGTVRGWIAPAGDNLAARLIRETNHARLCDQLFLSVLTRYPTREESHEIGDYLSARNDDRAAAMQEIVWSLLASAEFRFNH